MINYTYPCEDHTNCHPYTVELKSGNYLFEVWGAQGGNVSDSAQGGFGGYSKGFIRIFGTMTFYVFVGASGFKGSTTGFTQASYNGGGRGTTRDDNIFSCSGGGSTDIRTSLDVSSRIIVAGGGAGAARYASTSTLNSGGSGGGKEGEDGKDGKDDSSNPTLHGSGGTQDSPGSAYDNARKGSLLYGGNQSVSHHFGSGGGGGYYGGGCGHYYGATGGGGSGFISKIFRNGVMINGKDPGIPNFSTGIEEINGNKGNGAARITRVYVMTCGYRKNYNSFSVFFYITLISN